jgi:hypothetical protein
MSDRRPPPNDTPPNDTPSNRAPQIDPPRKEVPIREPSDREAPPQEAPPTEEEPGKPKPYERVQKLRLGVRVVWWSAVVLTVCFGGLALWMGVGQRDPFFAVFYLALAACCAVAGYGTLVAVRRPSAS